ncbi:TPA: hypothetical protein ACH3X2_005453 [Trebouxia sp. C0005]
MGTGIRHPSLVSLAIIIETRCNFEYIESHGASMPPPQEDSCKPILRFYSAHSTRNQARQAIANGHGILQAGVENIPPTALRLTDDPDASGMWTLEIKQEVVSLTLNGFVIQMKAKQPCRHKMLLCNEMACTGCILVLDFSKLTRAVKASCLCAMDVYFSKCFFYFGG